MRFCESHRIKRSVGAALIQNFSQVDAALEGMENSAGSADAEMSKVEETITFKINALKETWTGFLQELVNRDALKVIIDGLTSVSEAFTSLGAGGTIAVGGGLIAGLKLLSKQTDDTGQKIFSFGKIIRSTLGTDVLRSTYLDQYAENLKKVSAETAQNSINTVKLSTAEKEALITKAGLSVASKTQLTEQEDQIAEHLKNVLVIRGEISSENDLTVAKLEDLAATKSLTKEQAELLNKKYLNVAASKESTTALGKVTAAMAEQTTITGKLTAGWKTLVATVGLGKVVFGGIVTAVVAIGAAVIAYKKKQEQAIEDLNESVTSAFNTYKDAADTARTTTNTISGLEKEYATLSKGVNDLGQNVSLSSDEFDRYNEISNQIAELIPELVDHWTDEGNAVLTCKNNVEELTAAYKELSVAAASALINGTDGEGGADDIVANFQNTMNGVDTFWVKKSGLKDQQAEIENAKKAIQELRDLSTELKQDSNLYDAEGNYLQNLNLLAESSDKYADYQARILGAIADIQNYGADFNVEVPTFNIADNSLETYLADLNAVEKSVVASGQEISSQMTEARSQVKQLAEAYLTIDKGNLSDDQINAVKTYINGLSDDVIDGLNSKTAVDTLVTQITTAMAADTKVSGAIIGLLSIDKEGTVKSAQELASAYIAALDKALEEGRIKQGTYDNLLGGIDQWWQDEKVLNHNASKSIFGDLNSDALMSELSVVDAYTDQFNTEQANKWREWANTCGQTFTSAQAMIEAYEQSLIEATEDSGFNMTSFSSNVEEFQKVNEAYQQVAENISKGKIGKEIASDITAVEDLRDSFEGIDVSKFTDFESFDQIEQVLTSGTATAEEAQAGWDALATAYWGAKLAAGDYTEETQALISTQLQANGVTKESADSFVQALTAEANAKQMVADTGKELTEMSTQEINAMLAEAEGSQLDAAALLKLYLAKLQANGATVLTADDIANIEALGSAADINTAKLLAFQKAKANSTALENAYNDPNVTDKEIARLQKSAKELYSEAIKEVQSAANEATGSYSGIDLKYQPSSSSGSGGGGSSDSSETTDEWLEAFEEAYDRLGELRDQDKMDEYEYLQYLRALYEKFFKNKEDYVEEYAKYEREYLEGMKSLYESVFSYLTNQINNQISKLNDQKSAATESLNAQKSAAVDALNAEKEAAVAAIEEQIKAVKKQQEAIQDQIDAYQDEIDAINDANDAREREITLQKALYDLDKLNSQRTNLVYSESKGMHYESDLSGIRDARESVQDAKDDIAIANLEKKIELLEKEKDALDDLIDELEDQKDALEDYYDKLIDETEAYWDNLIEESEAYYDSLIEKLEAQVDRIDEMQNKLELAEMLAAIQDLTGQDLSGMWDGLVDGSEEAWSQLESVISSLEDGYMSIVATMNSDNDHVMEMFGKIADVDLSQTKNYLEETATAFDKLSACDFDVVANGVEGLRQAFSSLSEDTDVLAVLGQHIGEGVAQALEEAKTSAEEGSKGITESVGKGMTSSDAITSVEESGKKVAESAVNGVGKAVEGGELKESTDASGLKVSAAVGEGMTAEPAVAVLDEAGVKVVQTAATGVATAAEGSEETIVAGDAIVTGIINSMIDSLNGGAGIIGLQMFVDSFAAALQTAFSSLDTSNLLDLGQILGITSAKDIENAGTGSLSDIFQQLLDDITELNNQFQTIDISNVVLQFTNLKQAISDASAALGGDGAAMMSTGTESSPTGTGQNGTATSGTPKSNNTGGSLTEAMQSFGDTANEVLGGGEESESNGENEEGGSGVIGKFTTLRSKVEDVTAAIGLGDDEGGSGGKSSGTGSSSEDGGTLIEALQAEQEVAMNEETGLPKQVSMWQELYDNINKCIEAVHRLIDALTELEEFSLTVIFKGHSKAGGTAEASGSIGYASGSMYVAGSAYAKGTAGLEKDQRALVGESGTEMLIRGNQWQLIGQHGAEYKDLKAGDIIFSAAQTKELMKHGKLRSRGHTVGGNSYADGTPLNGMFDFAGKELSSSALNNISAQLTGILAPMTSSIDTINRNVADLAASVSNVSSVNQTSNITIGDIHVSGVQDTDSFAKAIKSYLPGKMMQELHK